MAKLSGNYEVVFILNPNLDEEATAAMVAKFKTLVEQNGTLAEVEEWGKRHALMHSTSCWRLFRLGKQVPAS